MRELFADRYYVLTREDDGIVVLTRTTERIEDLDGFIETMKTIRSTIETEIADGERGPGMLIDSRQAPARNDPEFEAATRPYRQAIQEAFRRAAVVVRTEVGKLQISRLSQEDGTGSAVFTDYDEALAFLRR